jgi:hypothetical protein
MGPASLSGTPAQLAETFRAQAIGCEVLGSPLYAALCERFADETELRGPIWDLLAEHADAPIGAAYALRVLGGLHKLALSGDAPELARHFPSTGGDADVDGAWAATCAVIAAPPPGVLDALTRPPQTNEVARSASLIGGFLVIAHETRVPMRVLEIGSSAGLNLRFDRFRYEQEGRGFGAPDATVHFEGLWANGEPPWNAPLKVVQRRGCDLDPVDPATDDGRLTLLSYVWPDQRERFERLSAAIDIAAGVAAPVDRAHAPEWLGQQLAAPVEGVVTVVFHSVMWQYLPADVQAEVGRVIGDAGTRATPAAPVAWLRLEPVGDLSFPRLTLTSWPGGEERLLAKCSFHLGPVTWLP